MKHLNFILNYKLILNYIKMGYDVYINLYILSFTS